MRHIASLAIGTRCLARAGSELVSTPYARLSPGAHPHPRVAVQSAPTAEAEARQSYDACRSLATTGVVGAERPERSLPLPDHPPLPGGELERALLAELWSRGEATGREL